MCTMMECTCVPCELSPMQPFVRVGVFMESVLDLEIVHVKLDGQETHVALVMIQMGVVLCIIIDSSGTDMKQIWLCLCTKEGVLVFIYISTFLSLKY